MITTCLLPRILDAVALIWFFVGWPNGARANPLEEAANAFAREQFADALKHLPTGSLDADAQLLRARALLGLGRYAEARGALGGLETKLPYLRDLIEFLRGEALLGLKRYTDAARAFRAAAMTKNSRWIYLSWEQRAEALRAGRHYSAAAEEYRHLLRIQSQHPRSPDWSLALALCQEGMGKRRLAATTLQELWLSEPASAAAARAHEELDRLRQAGVRVEALSLARRLARARALVREKIYPVALKELRELQRANRRSADASARINLELALALMKASQPADALEALRALPSSRSDPSPSHVRKLTATCLARLGRLDEAVRVVLGPGYKPTGRMPRGMEVPLGRAAKLLAEYAHYGEALAMRERLAALTRRPSAEVKRELAWLSYRAGRYDEAISRLEASTPKGRPPSAFNLYWRARAHARAGRPEKAEGLYREVLAKYGHTYYGILARSRLVEANRLKLPARTCPAEASGPASQPVDPEVLTRLAAFVARYGDLYPSLLRVQALWRLGMLADAKRELRLVAIDAAWIMARGRPGGWIQRPSVERLWRGGPLEARRFGKRERKIAKEGQPLRHALAGLLHRAGISYFGFQLGPPDPDPEKRRYPCAYPELVRKTARDHQLDPYLIWAIMRTESTYRLDVISRVGATGLMQIMPHTARRIAAAMKLKGFELSELFQPETNLDMAGWYLRAVDKKFRGQIQLMAAGYNGGPHHVARWLDMRGKACDMDEFVEEIPFSESRRYAKKILRLVRLYERVYCGKDDRLATNKLDTRYSPEPDF